MGKENNAVLSYLEDNERFADVFNCFYFGGREVIKPQEMMEASEVYAAEPAEKEGQRIRDIIKHLKSGACLKILAIEAQNDISYIMPWRIMEYDCLEYRKQIRHVQRENSRKDSEGVGVYKNAGERLGKFRRQDRIAPVYTLCLYHGVERWDGPCCLKDMMDFGLESTGTSGEEWEKYFADYPMRLICVNDLADYTGFKTSLKTVFALLPFRRNREGLKKMLEENPEYQKMDEETARTVSVLMGIKGFTEKQERYKEEEGYNMCQAIQEMIEEGRIEGRMEGQSKEQENGILILMQLLSKDYGIKEKEIADKLQKYYALSEEDAWDALHAKKI